MFRKLLLFTLFYALNTFAFIGGHLAKPNEFPSVLMIEYNCSASLIAKNKILVAAHCVLPFKNSYSLQSGQKIHIYSSPTALGSQDTEATIDKVIIHPDWVKKVNSGLYIEDFMKLKDSPDLAVIILTENFQSIYNTQVAEIDYSNLKKNQEIFVGGYGCEAVNVPTRDPKYKYSVKKISALNGNLFTADQKNVNNKSTSMGCEGDSGGPVFISNAQNKKILVGVNSSVVGSEIHGKLSMISLAKFQIWLSAVINQN